MMRMARWGLCVALGLGMTAAGLVALDAEAASQKKTAAAPPAAPVDPPMVRTAQGITLTPPGMHWGMTEEQVVQFCERLIDEDYRPLYRKTQAGPEMARLDAEVANVKAAFRRSRIEFGNLPTGVDSTALKGEYTYRNGEVLMTLRRLNRGPRHLFFIGGKLWKIYDEIALAEGRPLGATYEDALKKLATTYGVVGRVTEPDYALGRSFREVDWQDARTHLRVLDRAGMKIVALVYEDRATLANLANLRVNKPVDDSTLDPEIEALIRPPSAGPAVPEDKGNTKGNKR